MGKFNARVFRLDKETRSLTWWSRKKRDAVFGITLDKIHSVRLGHDCDSDGCYDPDEEFQVCCLCDA